MTDTKVKFTASGAYIDKKDAVEASNRILTDALNGGPMTDTPKVRDEVTLSIQDAFAVTIELFKKMQSEKDAEIARLIAQVQLKCVGIEALIDDREKLTKERDEALAKANKYFNDWSRAHHLYGEALERAERAERTNDEENRDWDKIWSENTALRERAAGLVSALEVYAATNETFPEYGDVARQALKDWVSRAEAFTSPPRFEK